jgi:hypothetical protein
MIHKPITIMILPLALAGILILVVLTAIPSNNHAFAFGNSFTFASPTSSEENNSAGNGPTSQDTNSTENSQESNNAGNEQQQSNSNENSQQSNNTGNAAASQQSNNTGNAAASQQSNNTGNAAASRQSNNTGNAAASRQSNNTGNAAASRQSNNTGNAAASQQSNNTGNAAASQQSNNTGNAAASQQSNNTGKTYCDSCNNDIYSGSADFANMVLAVHNRERAAVGVPPLVWSDKLVADAKPYAEHLLTTAELEHPSQEWVDTHPNSVPGYEGENLAWRTNTTTVPLAQMQQGWISEKNNYHGGPTDFNGVGHYTQMVWRDTKEVGCATASGNGRDVLDCRYSPAGNVIGQKPY